MYYIRDVADLLFVTLKKDPADFKPSTRYHDYALSPTLFHWESQSGTSVGSPTGQRYIHHQERGTHVLLFAREATETVGGETEPFLFLGPAKYVSHQPTKPIAISWRLTFSMPPDFVQAARAVA